MVSGREVTQNTFHVGIVDAPDTLNESIRYQSVANSINVFPTIAGFKAMGGVYCVTGERDRTKYPLVDNYNGVVVLGHKINVGDDVHKLADNLYDVVDMTVTNYELKHPNFKYIVVADDIQYEFEGFPLYEGCVAQGELLDRDVIVGSSISPNDLPNPNGCVLAVYFLNGKGLESDKAFHTALDDKNKTDNPRLTYRKFTDEDGDPYKYDIDDEGRGDLLQRFPLQWVHSYDRLAYSFSNLVIRGFTALQNKGVIAVRGVNADHLIVSTTGRWLNFDVHVDDTDTLKPEEIRPFIIEFLDNSNVRVNSVKNIRDDIYICTNKGVYVVGGLLQTNSYTMRRITEDVTDNVVVLGGKVYYTSNGYLRYTVFSRDMNDFNSNNLILLTDKANIGDDIGIIRLGGNDCLITAKVTTLTDDTISTQGSIIIPSAEGIAHVFNFNKLLQMKNIDPPKFNLNGDGYLPVLNSTARAFHIIDNNFVINYYGVVTIFDITNSNPQASGILKDWLLVDKDNKELPVVKRQDELNYYTQVNRASIISLHDPASRVSNIINLEIKGLYDKKSEVLKRTTAMGKLGLNLVTPYYSETTRSERDGSSLITTTYMRLGSTDDSELVITLGEDTGSKETTNMMVQSIKYTILI